MPTQVLLDKTIKHSYMDRFELTAILHDYEVTPGDKFYLTVEQYEQKKLQIQATYTQVDNDLHLLFEATSEQMSTLPVGNYIYDIHMENSGELKTPMFVAKFKVEEVAHDGTNRIAGK